jgi:hypothetical protein
MRVLALTLSSLATVLVLASAAPAGASPAAQICDFNGHCGTAKLELEPRQSVASISRREDGVDELGLAVEITFVGGWINQDEVRAADFFSGREIDLHVDTQVFPVPTQFVLGALPKDAANMWCHVCDGRDDDFYAKWELAEPIKLSDYTAQPGIHHVWFSILAEDGSTVESNHYTVSRTASNPFSTELHLARLDSRVIKLTLTSDLLSCGSPAKPTIVSFIASRSTPDGWVGYPGTRKTIALTRRQSSASIVFKLPKAGLWSFQEFGRAFCAGRWRSLYANPLTLSVR